MLGNTQNISIHNSTLADSCGSSVLGMNGSLTSYIQTGKTHSGYDSFSRKNKTDTKKMTRSQKDAQILKKICVGALGAAATLFLGCKLKKGATSIVDGVKKLLKIAPSESNIEKAKKTLSKLV